MRVSIALCMVALIAAAAAPAANARVMLATEGGSSSKEGGGSASHSGTGHNATAANATLSLADAVKLAPQYNLSILIKAVEAANLTEPLFNGSTTWTIFAPTDAAFEQLLSALGVSASDLLANTTLVTDVLSYHVVPGVAATAESLSDSQSLPTLLSGKTLTVSKPPSTPGKVAVFNPSPAGAAPPAADVIVPDIKAGKSVIHVIDRVLLP